MKRLLILAYDFPPYVSVGGLRPYSWYKYLHEFEVFPVVVTRQWSNTYGNGLDYVATGVSDNPIVEESEQGTIIRAPYTPNAANRIMLNYGERRFRLLRKTISAWYEFAQWFLPVGPKYGIYKAANEYLKNNRVDCIIATGDPFVLFRYAARLSQKYSIPWIADYRDPWIQSKKTTWPKWFFALLERHYVSTGALITTVSDFLIRIISTNLPRKKFELIYNGYDPENIVVNENSACNQVLTLAFTGTLYPWHPVEEFLQVVNQFCANEKTPLRLQFFGVNQTKIIEAFSNQAVNELQIEIFPKMPNKDLNRVLSATDGLILFNDYNIIGTKIFDYLALKKRILFCFSNDREATELKQKYYHLPTFPDYKKIPQLELIVETESGTVVRDREHLYEVLQEWSREFKTNGRLQCQSHGYEFYSRRNQAKRLAEVIEQLLTTKKV